jgi:ribosomal-protein-alanine N-acetyltransferase
MATDEVPFDGGRLRSWTNDDAPILVQAWADADIARWNAVPPEPTLETATRWISGVQERLEKRLSVDMVVDACALGVVGEVGLSGFSDAHQGALIGYWLLPEGRGQGLAGAAVLAFTAWAHEAFGLDVIVARCDESNLASQAVARRAGFQNEGRDSSGNQLWRSRTRGG